MSFSFRNLFSQEDENKKQPGLGAAGTAFDADRGQVGDGNGGNSEGQTGVYSVQELLPFIPPAISAQNDIPMDQEVRIPLSENGGDVKLSTLYQLCPGLFAAEITPLNDSTVNLPPAQFNPTDPSTNGEASAPMNPTDQSMNPFADAANSPLNAAFGAGGNQGSPPSEAGADANAAPPSAAGTTPADMNNPFFSQGGAGQGTPQEQAGGSAFGPNANPNQQSQPQGMPPGNSFQAIENNAPIQGAAAGGDMATFQQPAAAPRQDAPSSFEGNVNQNPPAAGEPPNHGPETAPTSASGSVFDKNNQAQVFSQQPPPQDNAPPQQPQPQQQQQQEAHSPQQEQQPSFDFASPVDSAASDSNGQGTPSQQGFGNFGPVADTAGDSAAANVFGNPAADASNGGGGQQFTTLFSEQAQADQNIPTPNDSAAPPAGNAFGNPAADQGQPPGQTQSESFSDFLPPNPDEQSMPHIPALAEKEERLNQIGKPPEQGGGPSPSPESGPQGGNAGNQFQGAHTFTAPNPEAPANVPASAPPANQPAAAAAPSPEKSPPAQNIQLLNLTTASGAAAAASVLAGNAAGNQQPAINNPASPPEQPAQPQHSPPKDAQQQQQPQQAAPRPEPAAAVEDNVVQDVALRAVFGTDEKFTLRKVASLIVCMPGVCSCAIVTPVKALQASRTEETKIGDDAKAMSANVSELARLTGVPDARSFTIHTDKGILSLFSEGKSTLTVRHEPGEFEPGVREKLMLVAGALDGLTE